jgi:hypothetical protein
MKPSIAEVARRMRGPIARKHKIAYLKSKIEADTTKSSIYRNTLIEMLKEQMSKQLKTEIRWERLAS